MPRSSGIALTGKLAIVTGGYSGIGTAVSRGLSDAGASVVVPARRPDQARKEVGDVPGVEIACCASMRWTRIAVPSCSELVPMVRPRRTSMV